MLCAIQYSGFAVCAPRSRIACTCTAEVCIIVRNSDDLVLFEGFNAVVVVHQGCLQTNILRYYLYSALAHELLHMMY
jgi:hypothetical protein